MRQLEPWHLALVREKVVIATVDLVNQQEKPRSGLVRRSNIAKVNIPFIVCSDKSVRQLSIKAFVTAKDEVKLNKDNEGRYVDEGCHCMWFTNQGTSTSTGRTVH